MAERTVQRDARGNGRGVGETLESRRPLTLKTTFFDYLKNDAIFGSDGRDLGGFALRSSFSWRCGVFLGAASFGVFLLEFCGKVDYY